MAVLAYFGQPVLQGLGRALESCQLSLAYREIEYFLNATASHNHRHADRKTEKEWKAYIEALVEKFGVDELKTLVKQYEGQKKWKKYVELAIEKIKSDEEKKS